MAKMRQAKDGDLENIEDTLSGWKFVDVANSLYMGSPMTLITYRSNLHFSISSKYLAALVTLSESSNSTVVSICLEQKGEKCFQVPWLLTNQHRPPKSELIFRTRS